MPSEKKPDDVGESITRKGEDVVKKEGKEAGRRDAGTQGPSERPVGTSTPRDQTGVSPAPDKDEAAKDDTGTKKP